MNDVVFLATRGTLAALTALLVGSQLGEMGAIAFVGALVVIYAESLRPTQ